MCGRGLCPGWGRLPMVRLRLRVKATGTPTPCGGVWGARTCFESAFARVGAAGTGTASRQCSVFDPAPKEWLVSVGSSILPFRAALSVASCLDLTRCTVLTKPIWGPPMFSMGQYPRNVPLALVFPAACVSSGESSTPSLGAGGAPSPWGQLQADALRPPGLRLGLQAAAHFFNCVRLIFVFT